MKWCNIKKHSAAQGDAHHKNRVCWKSAVCQIFVFTVSRLDSWSLQPVKLTDLIDMSLPQSIARVSAVHSGLLVFRSSTDYIHFNRKSQVTAMTGTEASRWCPHDEEEYPNQSALFGHVAFLSCFLEVWGTLWQVMWKMVSDPKLTKP